MRELDKRMPGVVWLRATNLALTVIVAIRHLAISG